MIRQGQLARGLAPLIRYAREPRAEQGGRHSGFSTTSRPQWPTTISRIRLRDPVARLNREQMEEIVAGLRQLIEE